MILFRYKNSFFVCFGQLLFNRIGNLSQWEIVLMNYVRECGCICMWLAFENCWKSVVVFMLACDFYLVLESVWREKEKL